MQSVAIGFDFDHTLGVDNKLERDAFVRVMQEAAAAEHRSIDSDDAGAAIDGQIARYRRGQCSLEQAFSQAFYLTLAQRDTPGSLEAFRTMALSMVQEYVQPLPGVCELLEHLDRSEVPYAILTNGWNPLQQRKADRVGFTKPVFVSDDIGARKPSVAAFNVLREHFKLRTREVWYVGDDPMVDVVGALGAGMRAIWFDWERHKYPTDIPAPTAIVTALTDIPSIVM